MEKNYIVRIYHRKKNMLDGDQKQITGLVEEPLTGIRQSFHDPEKLWEILSDSLSHKIMHPEVDE